MVRDALLTVAVGVGVGLVGARAFGTALRGQLYGVGAHDPANFGAVAAVAAGTALLAAWIPARASSRLEVSRVLRDE